jgi:hypothetical protein
MTAAKYLWARGNMSWLISDPTVRTDETIAPSGTFKISGTRSLIRDEMLKLRQRARERQIASLKNIDRHGDSSATQMLNTLPVVGGCHNRISTE